MWGLFGRIDDPNAEVRNLGVIDPNVNAEAASDVGALVGWLQQGTVNNCYVKGGRVSGCEEVGGLVGSNGGGSITDCHSTASVGGETNVGGVVGSLRYGALVNCSMQGLRVSGTRNIGGLLGYNYRGTLESSFAHSIVQGEQYTGGLVGASGEERYLYYESQGEICNCYAESIVIGKTQTGGLMGANYGGSIINCYSKALVIGGEDTGGLIGDGEVYLAVACFWDMQTTRQLTSAAGKGKTTAQMQSAATFRAWRESPHENIWTIDDGNDYPRLWWENRPGSPIGPPEFVPPFPGSGTEEDPYLIYTADQLNAIGADPNTWDKNFKLMADIDLNGFADTEFNKIGLEWECPFSGFFDGNDHTIANFRCTCSSGDSAGLFRNVKGANAEIKNLGLIAPYVSAHDVCFVGALVGRLTNGMITDCYVEDGVVAGKAGTGVLVGALNDGTIRNCHVDHGVIVGQDSIGTLVGYSYAADIVNCYSTGTIIGDSCVGGLVGDHLDGSIQTCYGRCLVMGNSSVGGLVGGAGCALINNSYATGMVVAHSYAGGLLGSSRIGRIVNSYASVNVSGDSYTGGLAGSTGAVVSKSFWDVETSGQLTSDGGMGLSTAEMQMAATFLAAGWDFVGETENGVEDIWWIDERQDYPRLWWEARD
ncbi:MAG: hypothetical protein JW741_01455 [Sedimentisphaerales bacterium]|nr:hypothetical protein [Sedimentisphaerales bacterium]